MITLLSIFTVLFSLHGFSQDTEKSEHPLLDKYYPRAQVIDTNKTVGTQITSSSQTKPAPAATSINTAPKTLIVTTTPADTTTRSVETIPTITTKSAVTSTTVVNTPTTVTRDVPPPVQKTPPSAPYRDTRLGSSTPQYDTWQKNDNGAGAVTTSPK